MVDAVGPGVSTDLIGRRVISRSSFGGYADYSIAPAKTLLFLDDMSRPDHEPKAFAEFMDESGLRFRPVAADRSLNHACFECVGEGQAESRSI